MQLMELLFDCRSPLESVEIAFAELLQRKEQYGSYCEKQYLKTMLSILQEMQAEPERIAEIFKDENIEGLL